MATIYEHTQRGWLILIILAMGLMGIVTAVLASQFHPWPALLPTLLALTLVGLLFSSLTIRVDATTLAWGFGPGLIRKSVPVETITSIEPMRMSWWWGWGIHLTPSGWLYNVSGLDGVRVTLQTGKQFLLGTDDAPGLRTAVLHAGSLRNHHATTDTSL